MSFSSDVKSELCALPLGDRAEMLAECYGMLLFSGKFSEREILLKSESPDACARFEELLTRLFAPIIEREQSLSTGKKRLSRVSLPVPSECADIFAFFGHSRRDIRLRINRANLSEDGTVASFLRGAFLSCGSVMNPDKGYRLELNISRKTLADNLITLMNEVEVFSVNPRIALREGMCSVYIKGSEKVCDFLAYIGASKSVIEVINASVLKEIRNSVNRRMNSDLANIRKISEASAKQVRAIKLIEKYRGLDSLDEGLREIARLRLERPGMSLKEIGESLEPKISRSGVNHRIERILKIAEGIKGENDGKPEL